LKMPRVKPEPKKSKRGNVLGRPPMQLDEHRWWRDLRQVDHETGDEAGVTLGVGAGVEFDLCWRYLREQTSVMHHGKTRELRPTLFVELSPNRDMYLADPYAYFLANGDADARVGERLGLDGGSISAPDRWCGNEWCFNPVHTAVIRRGEYLNVKREIAREGYAALVSERDAPVREVRVPRPFGGGYVTAGEIADDMYWSAARRVVLISGHVEEGGVYRWVFSEGVHWAVRAAFLELLAETPDPVAVRAGMLEPSPVPDDQADELFARARSHVEGFRSWQSSWQRNADSGLVRAKSRAKLSRVTRRGKA
jgi:hypothetical protein